MLGRIIRISPGVLVEAWNIFYVLERCDFLDKIPSFGE